MSTKRFLLQKILQLFLTLFLVTAITFILMQLSPIDAAEAYSRRIFTVDETRIEAVREQMGLNRPIVVQYLDWLNDLLHFDLGNSYVDNRDVFLIVGSALKETACIVLLSAVLQAVGAEYIIPGDFQTISGVAGTGPYIYDEYVAGEYTRFVRNEDYWGETPYWDEIIVKYIPDSTSRLQALQTGEIDMIYGGTLSIRCLF